MLTLNLFKTMKEPTNILPNSREQLVVFQTEFLKTLPIVRLHVNALPFNSDYHENIFFA